MDKGKLQPAQLATLKSVEKRGQVTSGALPPDDLILMLRGLSL